MYESLKDLTLSFLCTIFLNIKAHVMNIYGLDKGPSLVENNFRVLALYVLTTEFSFLAKKKNKKNPLDGIYVQV